MNVYLTPRQREVLIELGQGRSHKTIASHLGLSVPRIRDIIQELRGLLAEEHEFKERELSTTRGLQAIGARLYGEPPPIELPHRVDYAQEIADAKKDESITRRARMEGKRSVVKRLTEARTNRLDQILNQIDPGSEYAPELARIAGLIQVQRIWVVSQSSMHGQAWAEAKPFHDRILQIANDYDDIPLRWWAKYLRGDLSYVEDQLDEAIKYHSAALYSTSSILDQTRSMRIWVASLGKQGESKEIERLEPWAKNLGAKCLEDHTRNLALIEAASGLFEGLALAWVAIQSKNNANRGTSLVIEKKIFDYLSQALGAHTKARNPDELMVLRYMQMLRTEVLGLSLFNPQQTARREDAKNRGLGATTVLGYKKFHRQISTGKLEY